MILISKLVHYDSTQYYCLLVLAIIVALLLSCTTTSTKYQYYSCTYLVLVALLLLLGVLELLLVLIPMTIVIASGTSTSASCSRSSIGVVVVWQCVLQQYVVRTYQQYTTYYHTTSSTSTFRLLDYCYQNTNINPRAMHYILWHTHRIICTSNYTSTSYAPNTYLKYYYILLYILYCPE